MLEGQNGRVRFIALAVCFLATAIAAPAAAQVSVDQVDLYIVRTGVKVYVDPPGLTRDGAIEDVDVIVHVKNPHDTADIARQDIDIGMRNTGGLPMQVHGSVELRRPDNSLAATLPVEQFP